MTLTTKNPSMAPSVFEISLKKLSQICYFFPIYGQHRAQNPGAVSVGPSITPSSQRNFVTLSEERRVLDELLRLSKIGTLNYGDTQKAFDILELE